MSDTRCRYGIPFGRKQQKMKEAAAYIAPEQTCCVFPSFYGATPVDKPTMLEQCKQRLDEIESEAETLRKMIAAVEKQ